MVCYTKTTIRDDEHRLWYGVAAVEDGRVTERIDELTTDDQSVQKLLDNLLQVLKQVNRTLNCTRNKHSRLQNK